MKTDTIIDVKGTPIPVGELLGNAPPDELKGHFDGGWGLTRLLMPSAYHRFNSPVDGIVSYVQRNTEHRDGENWLLKDIPRTKEEWLALQATYEEKLIGGLGADSGSDGTSGGQSLPDASGFGEFNRGIIIIEVHYMDGTTQRTGYVASIPVGLVTIGSVVIGDAVTRGTGCLRRTMQQRHGLD